MSKYLKVATGDYNVVVQPGGAITLDTGFQQGNVIITGNLTVSGSTTTVTSQNLDIKNLLMLQMELKVKAKIRPA